MPAKIGVVTSPKGAVIRDIIHVLSRRFPGFRLTLYPSAVQGSGAAGQLRAGIRYFNEKTKVDVIIIGRGGGSIEDLWAFNDEELAREIYESGIPVISAVGHETDFTISDFVADLRAPTPSAAAELAVPDKSALLVRLYEYRKALTNALTHYMDIQSNKLRSCVTHRALISPRLRFEAESQRYDSLIKRLRGSLEGVTNMKSANCSILIGKLQALNPLSVLDRGYAIVTDESDCVITSVNSIGVHRNINIRVADGIIDAETRSIRQGGENGFRKL